MVAQALWRHGAASTPSQGQHRAKAEEERREQTTLITTAADVPCSDLGAASYGYQRSSYWSK